MYCTHVRREDGKALKTQTKRETTVPEATKGKNGRAGKDSRTSRTSEYTHASTPTMSNELAIGPFRNPDSEEPPILNTGIDDPHLDCCSPSTLPSTPPSTPPSTLSSPPTVQSTTVSSLAGIVEDELPLVVVDKKRKLSVYISDPEYCTLPGAEILKLSTEEYFRRVDEHKRKSSLTIRSLRNKIETLQKEVSIKENTHKIEKEEAVHRVSRFWRNFIEGDTHGGRMVRAALNISYINRCV